MLEDVRFTPESRHGRCDSHVRFVPLVASTSTTCPPDIGHGQGHEPPSIDCRETPEERPTAVYNGTKAFLDSFSYALQEELKETNVTVTCLMPGATETEFFWRADMMDTNVGTDKNLGTWRYPSGQVHRSRKHNKPATKQRR